MRIEDRHQGAGSKLKLYSHVLIAATLGPTGWGGRFTSHSDGARAAGKGKLTSLGTQRHRRDSRVGRHMWDASDPPPPIPICFLKDK